MSRTQIPISARVHPEVETLRIKLAEKLSATAGRRVGKSAVLELAIRQMAARLKVTA